MTCKSLFITATGTDIGKTYVSALILKKLNDLGLKCGYYKPALSGVSPDTLSDIEYVKSFAHLGDDRTCVTYMFEEAVSPHLASNRCGVKISLDNILKDYSKMTQNLDYLLVEGAGGITCPFNLSEQTILLPDVIKNLDTEILIVADGGLGTINSVVLTVEYAKSKEIAVRGVILNNFDKNNFMHQDNLIQIERLTGIKVVATVQNGDDEICIDENVLKGLFK